MEQERAVTCDRSRAVQLRLSPTNTIGEEIFHRRHPALLGINVEEQVLIFPSQKHLRPVTCTLFRTWRQCNVYVIGKRRGKTLNPM